MNEPPIINAFNGSSALSANEIGAESIDVSPSSAVAAPEISTPFVERPIRRPEHTATSANE